MTEYKRVLIQPGEEEDEALDTKSTHKFECTIIRKIQTSLEVFKTFYPASD